MRDTSGFVRQAEEYDLTAVWVAAGRDCQRCGKPLITARRAADLDEFRLDDDQDDYRADLGVLRPRGGRVRGAIRVPGPSALLTRNPLALVIGMPMQP